MRGFLAVPHRWLDEVAIDTLRDELKTDATTAIGYITRLARMISASNPVTGALPKNAHRTFGAEVLAAFKEAGIVRNGVGVGWRDEVGVHEERLETKRAADRKRQAEIRKTDAAPIESDCDTADRGDIAATPPRASGEVAAESHEVAGEVVREVVGEVVRDAPEVRPVAAKKVAATSRLSTIHHSPFTMDGDPGSAPGDSSTALVVVQAQSVVKAQALSQDCTADPCVCRGGWPAHIAGLYSLRTGGTMSPARCGKALAPSVGQHGVPEVVRVVIETLNTKPTSVYTPEKVAQEFGILAGTHAEATRAASPRLRPASGMTDAAYRALEGSST